MCSGIVALVFTVMLHKLTVKNLYRVSTDVPMHCLMHATLFTELEPVNGVLADTDNYLSGLPEEEGQ